MARRLRGLDAGRLEPDHLHTNERRVGTRRSRRTPRRARSVFALLAGVIGLAFTGGALFSAGSAAALSDPYANSVRAVAGAPALGPATGLHLNASLVSVAATRSGRGYWTVASDGGVFTFGDARFFGSTGNLRLAAPIVGVVPTPSGAGYWLVAMDGGVFSYGDAAFYGSTGGNAFGPSAAIVGMAATPTGHGYWLVAADGGVFTFGDATFRGSATGLPHGAPILAMAATRSGKGYYLLSGDGGVFAFGDARFAGTMVTHDRVSTGIAVPTNGRGYMVVRADGSVSGFGGAPSVPSFDFGWSRHPTRGITARPGGGAWLALSYTPPPPPAPSATVHAASAGSPSGDAFLACTRAHESSGNYSINTGNGYYGAYQFLQSTWNSTAAAAGRPDLVGVSPANAAPGDQDQLALFLYHQQGAGPWGGRCAGLP